jgi:hypothetical protein
MIILRSFESTRIASDVGAWDVLLYTKGADAAMAGPCAADEAETVAGPADVRVRVQGRPGGGVDRLQGAAGPGDRERNGREVGAIIKHDLVVPGRKAHVPEIITLWVLTDARHHTRMRGCRDR